MTGIRRWLTLVALTAVTLSLASCASNVRVFVNPDADMAFYTKIAVLTFTNVAGDPLAGQRVTRGFLTELIMTNRYQVIQPEEFRAYLAKTAGPPTMEGSWDPTKIKEAATALGATAILRGGVTEYQLERSESGDVPLIAFDAELVDVATGNVVWRSSISRRGKSPVPFAGGSRSLGRLTQQACQEMVAELRKGAL